MGKKFEILGGATNRIVLQMEGYALKFAMDEQGYRDNLIEYSLSPELQDKVTKTYETNGYIAVAEYIEVINTQEKWELHRNEIRKILDTLCRDYLLGDVGYLKKNMTNWGLRDGKPVILDYAYCHRATENLFTCSRCGGVLTYDSNYDILMCSDRTSCKAKYTYNERKRIQGKEVDDKMINEQKMISVRLPRGVKEKEIETFEDRLVGDNYFIIDNPGDKHRYEQLKEDIEMQLMLNSMEGDEDMSGLTERFEALVSLAQNPDDEEAKKILYDNLSEDSVPEPIYTDNYQENYAYGHTPIMRPYVGGNPESYGDIATVDDEDDDDFDMEGGLAALIDKTKQSYEEADNKYAEDARTQEDAYLAEVRKREAEKKKAEPVEKSETTEAEPEQGNKAVEEPADESPVDEASEDPTPTAYHDTSDDTSTSGTSRILINGKPIDVGEEMKMHVGD
jgi:hypothetical protein